MTGLPIPDTALDDRQGFVGTAGSGKTYGAGTAVERLLDRGARCVIIDPLDVWFGLRLTADGKRQAYPIVIFGGAHGDLPVNEHAGTIIGETVAGMAESCIISFGGFDTAASERRFMLAFLTALYRNATREPVHLIFDEADMFAPQRILDKEGEATKLLGRMETMVRRGRVRGFIPWLITQRPAVINKNVLSQIDGLISFKLTSSQDRKALGEWVAGQADEGQWRGVYNALPTLERGTGVVWLPAHGVLATKAFPSKKTFDSSATPKRGERHRHVDLSPLDIDRLKQRLSTVEEEAKANDPKILKAEIARLKKQMADAAAQASKLGHTPDPAALGEAERRGYERGVTEAIGFASVHQRDAFEYARERAQAAADALAADRDRATSKEWAAQLREYAKPNITSPAPKVATVPSLGRETRQPIARQSDGTLGAERKPLVTLASAYPGGLTEAQWATIAGFKRTGGTWSTYKSRLRSAGMIEQRGSLWHATEAGIEAVGSVPPAPSTTEERLAMWRSALGSGPRKILDALVARYPEGVGRDELAALVEMTATGGTFSTYLSRLSGNGLIERGGGMFRASGALFQ